MTTVHQAEGMRLITLIMDIPEVDEGSYRTTAGEEGVTEEEDAVLSVDQSSLRELHVFLPTFL